MIIDNLGKSSDRRKTKILSTKKDRNSSTWFAFSVPFLDISFDSSEKFVLSDLSDSLLIFP